MPIRAQGYDPGFAAGGVAVVEKDGNRYALLHHAKVVTKPKQTEQERTSIVWHALSVPIRKFHPAALGIEDQTGVSTAARVQGRRQAEAIARGSKVPKMIGFSANNDKTIGVSWLARGVAIAYGCEWEMFQPKAIKKAMMGFGGSNADKDQITAMVKIMFPELAGVNLSEHEGDAIAIAVLMCRAVQAKMALVPARAKSGQVTA